MSGIGVVGFVDGAVVDPSVEGLGITSGIITERTGDGKDAR